MDYTVIEYPEHVYNIKEIAALSHAIDIEMSKLGTEIDNLEADTGIETSTERGIARREAFLRINPPVNATLEERKQEVLLRYSDRGLYTEEYLRKKLNRFIGESQYILTVDTEQCIVYFRANLESKRMYQRCVEMLEKIVPLHMLLDTDLLYNRWADLSGMVWDELAVETWEHWKSDVLE